jgi:hypothetical protein
MPQGKRACSFSRLWCIFERLRVAIFIELFVLPLVGFACASGMESKSQYRECNKKKE